ncbi:MAG TPA: FMN-binding protein [Terriglobales bacterium]|nr:FMN-binding protein [Terriglobales bacterium]
MRSKQIRTVSNSIASTRFASNLIGLLILFCSALPLHAEIYLTEEQAVKIAIPNAVSVDVETKQLTPAQRDSLQRASRLRFPEPQYRFFVGRNKDGSVAGYALIMNEVGKEEFITFIVGITPKRETGEVVVMEYRETRGGEVREKRFLRQFRGKKTTDPIQVNNDIENYTGATLSSHAIAAGVKKALLLTDTFYLHP